MRGTITGENPALAKIISGMREQFPPSTTPELFGQILAVAFALLDTISVNNNAIAKSISSC